MDLESILSARDLSESDLSGSSLGGCNLRGKILRNANLSNAHLGAADLRGADLRGADLRNANLGAAILIGADMRGCDLTDANLTGAKLAGADLRAAQGVNLTAPLPLTEIVKPIRLEPTEEYEKAKQNGFYPIAHWGKRYNLDSGGILSCNQDAWRLIRSHLGEAIFGDKQTFSEVRLVQRYKHFSQWAYMISQPGFERIAHSLGLSVLPNSA